MISSIPLLPSLVVPTILVSRSTDGGATFGNPVEIPPPAEEGQSRQELDRVRQPPGQPVLRPLLHGVRQLRRGRPRVHEHVLRRRPHVEHADLDRRATPKGLGGQPVVQPDGTVIVPFESLNGTIGAFRSTNGGATWSKEVPVSKIRFHAVAGGLRTSPLPSAEIDGAGTVVRRLGGLPLRAEVRGQRHRLHARSADGVNWSAVRASRSTRSAAASTTSSPVWRVDPATSGAAGAPRADVLLLPERSMHGGHMSARRRLHLLARRRRAAGAHRPQLAGPMSLADIAATSQGPMVGDYISTSFNSGGHGGDRVGDRQPPQRGRLRRGDVGTDHAAGGDRRRRSHASIEQCRRRQRPGRRSRRARRQERLEVEARSRPCGPLP